MYQWMEVETETSGGTASTIIERDDSGRSHRRTEYSPATTTEKRCFYTLYAHRTSSGWRIDDFRNPEPGC